MGYLIDDATLWLEMLRASIIDPQIRPPAAFPDLSPWSAGWCPMPCRN
jgi:hypothetical protein